jgi:hypothetical protein
MMKSPERVILEALRYDHSNHGNVQRILAGLRDAGWQLTPAERTRLPETTRVFADSPSAHRRAEPS